MPDEMKKLSDDISSMMEDMAAEQWKNYETEYAAQGARPDLAARHKIIFYCGVIATLVAIKNSADKRNEELSLTTKVQMARLNKTARAIISAE